VIFGHPGNNRVGGLVDDLFDRSITDCKGLDIVKGSILRRVNHFGRVVSSLKRVLLLCHI